jgi:hypothetical protein
VGVAPMKLSNTQCSQVREKEVGRDVSRIREAAINVDDGSGRKE